MELSHLCVWNKSILSPNKLQALKYGQENTLCILLHFKFAWQEVTLPCLVSATFPPCRLEQHLVNPQDSLLLAVNKTRILTPSSYIRTSLLKQKLLTSILASSLTDVSSSWIDLFALFSFSWSDVSPWRQQKPLQQFIQSSDFDEWHKNKNYRFKQPKQM